MTVEQLERLDQLRDARHTAYVKARATDFKLHVEVWRNANRDYVLYRDSLRNSSNGRNGKGIRPVRTVWNKTA